MRNQILARGPRAYLADSTVAHMGARSSQQDAYASGYYTDADTNYWIGAIADGSSASPWSAIVADAAVRTAVRLGTSADFQRAPDRLIPATKAMLQEIPRWAAAQNAQALNAFRNVAGRARPDTTLLVATVTPAAEVVVAGVGNSRAYVLTEGGQLLQLTTDHTLHAGGGHESLTLTLGTLEHERRDDPATAVNVACWAEGGQDRAWRVLLCTDGVHGPLPDSHTAIGDLLNDRHTSPREIAKQLTTTAVAAGGAWADNALAMVVDIPDPTVGRRR
ncbi:PP2C family protein-serine/threonine phosphatase [Nocardia tengchongensis]|uniref:PP2C family protein-serine/threonine phosphatase n=1 Tax=Nocardia tengchongensis TaxID=2055889 RepID=UPI003658D334